jgi:hypothetical protein
MAQPQAGTRSRRSSEVTRPRNVPPDSVCSEVADPSRGLYRRGGGSGPLLAAVDTGTGRKDTFARSRAV